MFKGPLKDGVVGREIVSWFETWEDSNNLPIEAELLGYANDAKTEINYRLTFEDESVSDWHFVLEPKGIFNIESVDKFNDVL